ncbi:MAG: SurA N-terminal domain-containing protein [Planctomycetes bacterium]|nr:SurA N-terminal domain-containing protein [Planctomycetota bacterium]MCL4729094.1 SurA N-terminal domain-containing protein [Planctomycetota bacterium]
MPAIRALTAALLLALAPALGLAQSKAARIADGANEVLAIVDGKPVTFFQVTAGRDLQAEINALRQTRGGMPDQTDSMLEKQIVHQSLPAFILQLLLDAEADKLQLKITDGMMRALLARERKDAGIKPEDDQGWARFCKSRYGLTPAEYRERKRVDLRRAEALYYLAGARGALPAEIPVSTYFSLAVTPRDVRREFDATRGDWRVARNIDFRQFRLYYPQETTIQGRNKLLNALQDPATGVYARAQKGESLEAATDGLRKLLADERLPGVRVEITERKTAKDDSELDANTYGLVLSVPRTGGLSKLSAVTSTEEDGTVLEVVTFVQVFSREDGDLRNFEDPKVQESIRNRLFQRRFQENRVKVEQALMKRAAIVPEKLIAR